MKSIQAYLEDLNSPQVDISDPVSFGRFYKDVINPQKDSYNEAISFFSMIYSHRDMHKLYIDVVGKVYKASNPIHQKQLENLMLQHAPAALKFASIDSKHPGIVESCEPVVEYAGRLLNNGVLSFVRYLDLIVTTVQVANNPLDLNAVCHLPTCIINQGFFAKLGAYIALVVGKALDAMGNNRGKEMIANAQAKLYLNQSIFAALSIGKNEPVSVNNNADPFNDAVLDEFAP